MCAPRSGPERLLPLALLLAVAAPRSASAQLIDGISGWADVTVGLSSTKWKGPRVPFPTPRERPHAALRLDARERPLAVHGDPRNAARLLAVLEAAETVDTLTRAAGLLVTVGDAGQGGSGARDIYVIQQPEQTASAYVDASGSLGPLDGARAFAVVDARITEDRLLACTAQALFEARLLELDPAEAEPVRQSSAAYFASLVAGEGCEDRPELHDFNRDTPFDGRENGAAWLRELGRREDQNRGTFLAEMWEFARQRTWEGRDLRASPDLFEAIGKALELKHEEFADAAGAIALIRARGGFAPVRSLPYPALPAFMKRTELEQLGSVFVVVRIPEPQKAVRLRIWAKGDPGARYVLSAERLGTDDQPLAFYQAAALKDPQSQLSIELDAETRAVLIGVTNVGKGVPEFDEPEEPRGVTLTVDHVP